MDKNSMKALRFSALGSLDAMKLEDVPFPTKKEGEVVVQIKAAGLNPSDAKNVLGKFPYTTLPRTPGRDFSGIIVDGPKEMIGREVFGSGNELGFTRDGSHAEYLAVRSDGVADKPKLLTFVQAAACGVPYVTAWSALERTDVGRGMNVLVIGAAGAVGSAAVDLAKLRGANVFGAVRRDEQAHRLRERGVRPLLLKENDKLSDQTEKIFPDGAHVIFDTTGHWLNSSVAALAKYGRIAVIVAPGDGTVDVPIRMLYRRGGSIIGVDSMMLNSRTCAEVLAKIGLLFDEGLLLPPTGIVERGLAESVNVYRELGGESRGKSVFVM